VPTDSCKFSDNSTLYQGYVDKIIDNTSESSQIVYSLTAQNTIFALISINKFTRCGYILTRTAGDTIFRRTDQINNLDIFIYMNSKFIYVKKHIRTQISQLYRNILQQCNLELQMMQNVIAIAARSPDIFAYHFMRGPGYMALLAGEVIHIIKCVPVEIN